MHLPLLLYVLAGLTSVLGSPVHPKIQSTWQEQEQQAYNAPTSPRPLVLWHGLGDSHSSPGMLEFQKLIKSVHPGIFIHSVYIDPDLKEDQRASFYGNVDEQVELVADQLANVTELENGFDALGFSQGGQFLRAYVERHNVPPVRNLITFGSQHMGISDIPFCRPLDLLCLAARAAARRGVYGEWAQEHLVQAQYFRDPAQLPRYLSSNHFLTSLNNELPATREPDYARRLAELDTFVMVLFEKDRTVVPKESAWFGSYAVPEPDEELIIAGDVNAEREEKKVVSMREQPLYTEDWIGLRTLDEQGKVVFATCAGEHMQVDRACWEPIVRAYVGAPLVGA